MKEQFTLALALVFLAFGASDALAGTHKAGDSCVAAQLGVTEMDVYQTGIIGCFKTTAGSTSYVWKSTTGGGIGQCYTTRVIYQDANVTLYPVGGFTGSPSVSDVTGAAYFNTSSSIFTSIFGTAGSTPNFWGSSGNMAGAYCQTGYTRTGCSGAGASHISVGADDVIPTVDGSKLYMGGKGCFFLGEPGTVTGTWATTYYGYLDITCCKDQ